MDLSGATELYLLERGRVPLVLTPDSAGTPTVGQPQPVLYRTVYLSAVELGTGMIRAQGQLANENCWLLAPISCPDGPPHRSALLFTFQRALNGMSWRDEAQIFHGDKLLQFRPTTTQGPWQFLDEVRAGQSGYFLTGTAGDSSLWRLFRLETDAFHRAIFTLSPVRLAAGCPHADFSSSADTLLASEITAQYRDLCGSVVTHGYRDVVT